MADNLVFDEAVNATMDQSEFISKKWVYVNDNNSQNYTSQVVLDSTPLSNAGGWINWSEGYIVMPLVVQLTSTLPASLPIGGSDADYSWAFKAGFWNMINSMNVEFNNQNIIQQTPLTNVFRSFKAHTSFSQDDLLNEGSSLGYYPDNAGSWGYKVADSVDGKGIVNNRDAPSLFAVSALTGAQIANATFAGTANQLPVYLGSTPAGVPTSAGIASGSTNPSFSLGGSYSFNDGMLKRQEWYGYDPANSNGQDAIINSASCNSIYRSYKLTQTQNGSIVWHIWAKLRLKDLNEYFEKCPLLKGSTIRFYINTNQTAIKFSKEADEVSATTGLVTPGNLTLTSVSVIGGQTCPIMIASNDVGCGCSPLISDTYMLTCSIVQNTNSEQLSLGGNSYNTVKNPLSACRLYAPVYQFNPLAQQRYLQLAPTKKVVYRDIFQYQFTNIIPDGNFNFLVTNGIPNIKSVLVVPYLGATDNGGLPYSSIMSPYTSSPATPDPLPISNFNILVSGVNLFLNNELYDYEQFRQELMSSNQLNGNLTTGLTSGLISEEMFSRGYRYYYGNCARVLPAEAGVSRSVQIIGQNKSLLNMSLLVFVEFEKEMTIDLATGARID